MIDGTVKRGPEVMAFARDHGLKIISVADLIAYRQSRERLVEQARLSTWRRRSARRAASPITTPFDSVQHLALVFGDIGGGQNIPVRLHREDVVDGRFRRPPDAQCRL